MKILIFGANGWIGNKVYNYILSKNIDVIKAKSRANDLDDVKNELETKQPTHVMSFIGRTHGIFEGTAITTIDYLEKPGKLVENVRDNLFSPVSLALLCDKLGIHFTYLGTGCIFNYDSDHPYGKEINGFTENSTPNFFGSSYSIVKGFTDQLTKLLPNTLNLRIRMPITDENISRNFITKITSYSKICSIPNSMTVLDDMFPIILDMATQNITGTVNLTNPGLISHNEILEMYKEIVDSDFTWENFDIEEQDKILLSKRSNNYLDTSRLESMYQVKNIKDSVRDILIKMRNKRQNLNQKNDSDSETSE